MAVSIEETNVVERIIELDQYRLQEVFGSQPRILMGCRGQDTLLGHRRVVFRANDGCVVPRTCNIAERLQSIEMILENKRQAVVLFA